MKRIVCFALMILVLLCCFNISLSCPEHGPIYDQIDMYYTSYWAANSTHHYMQNEYDLVCAICGYVTHVTATPLLRVHRWSGNVNICIDCGYGAIHVK